MSLPFNNPFHLERDQFDETGSDEFSHGLNMSDSIATLRHIDDFNRYYMSDTASVPSALDSLHSSSQQPSISFGGTVTSDTSHPDPDPFPNSQDPHSHAIATSATPAEQAQDLLGFGGFTPNGPINLPEGDFLPRSPNENAASQPNTEQPIPERRNGVVVDVHTNDTHRVTSTADLESRVEALEYIAHLINGHLHDSECSPALISRIRKAKDTLEEPFKNYLDPGTESVTNDGVLKCLICRVTSLNKGVLTRHFKDKHFSQFEYSCPSDNCDMKQHRKDKMKAHIRTHPGINQNSYITTEFACPPHCHICGVLTDSWDNFYLCIISHHNIGAQPSERAASRRGSADHGQALQMGSMATVDPPPRVPSQQLTVPSRARRGRSPSFNAARSQLCPPPVRMNRSHSDTQAAQGITLNSNSSRSSAHIGDQSTRGTQPRRGRSPYPQPEQRNEIVRERRLRQRESSSRNTGSLLQCASCHESFECNPSEWRLMSGSRYFCFGCSTGRSSGSSAVPVEAQYSQQSQPSLETSVSSFDIFSQYWTPDTFSTRQNAIQPSPAFQLNQGQRNPRASSRAVAPRSFQGSPTQNSDVNNNPGVWSMRDTDSPTFSEEELCSPSFLGSKLSPTSPLTSTFPWSKTLPILLPPKPLQDLQDLLTSPSPWLHSSFEVSPWKDYPPAPRLSQCRCACNTRVTKTSSSIITSFSSGQPVELRFSFTTPSGPGSTLRNKVQIVVSLLSLRGTTKKKAEARKAIEGTANKADEDKDKDKDEDEDGKPDTRVVPLLSAITPLSVDTSLYDDQEIVPSNLPELEFTFDLDTQASFDRISQLTEGLVFDFPDSNETHDLEFLEKTRLLGYFVRYALFMITVLGRAADHEIRPQLGD